MELKRRMLTAGALFGAVGVSIGALGAHGLKPLLTQEALQSFETGVRYQIYHALLIFAMTVLPLSNEQFLRKIFICCAVGIILFSGSIYLLVTDELLGFSMPRVFGLVTPIGGVLLIISWLLFALYAARELKAKK